MTNENRDAVAASLLFYPLNQRKNIKINWAKITRINMESG